MSERRGATLARERILAIAVFTLLWSGVAPGARADSKEEVRRGLDNLLAKAPKGAQIGLYVADCDTGEIWYESGAQTPLKPASVMKLFTTAAALDRFGPEFSFKTRVYLCGEELLVIGGGDPGLGDERLTRRRGTPLHGEFDLWAGLLKERGITHVSGIALDDSIFDRECRFPDWPADQQDTWYQAPVGGINFNDNCLDASIHIRGGKIEIETLPVLPAAFFHNKLTRGAKHAPIVRRAPDLDVFEFIGTVKRNDSLSPISVGQPTVFFGFALAEALRQRGFQVENHVVRRQIEGDLPADAILLDTRSTSLEEVLGRCNTHSQNMFAECVLKSLAAYNPDGTQSGTAGSWPAGSEVLRATLRGMGIDVTGSNFADGSGLSHSNRVTAEQVVAVLRSMHRHKYAETYKASLARPGEDGTMRSKRWNKPELRERLRGKTGAISGVKALAGYVQRADGVKLAFALLINNGAADTLRVEVAEILVGS